MNKNIGEYDIHPMKREGEMTEKEKKELKEGVKAACENFYKQFGRYPTLPAGYQL